MPVSVQKVEAANVVLSPGAGVATSTGAGTKLPEIPNRKVSVHVDAGVGTSASLKATVVPVAVTRVRTYAVQESFPYEITFPTRKDCSDSSRSQIIVIDDLSPNQPSVDGEIWNSPQRLKLIGFGTHLAKVMANVPLDRRVRAFSRAWGWGFDASLAQMEMLIAEKKAGDPPRVFNMSYGENWTVLHAAKALKGYGEPEAAAKITIGNVHLLHKELKRALEKQADSWDPFRASKAKAILREAELIVQLIKQGDVVVRASGNEPTGSFNIVSALVPDIIVVSATNGAANHTSASNSSLVDTYRDGRVSFLVELPDGGSGRLNYSGTSYSAPKALAEVAELLDSGMKCRKINEYLRKKSDVLLHRCEPGTVIIREVTGGSGSKPWASAAMEAPAKRLTQAAVLALFDRQTAALVSPFIRATLEKPHLSYMAAVSMLREVERKTGRMWLDPRECDSLLGALQKVPMKQQSSHVTKVADRLPVRVSLERFIAEISNPN